MASSKLTSRRPRGARGVRSLWALDNLEGLTRLDDGSVSLAYLDPPFNSGRIYDAIIGLDRSAGSSHREAAFEDRWQCGQDLAVLLDELGQCAPKNVVGLVKELGTALGRNDTVAYVAMMAARLVEVRRVLKDEGSLYLHCDPAASHYLKILLDVIFGAENFRNEVVWKRTHAHSSSRRYGPIHDVILFYSKTPNYTWNSLYAEYDASYIERYFTHEDDRGRYQSITCTAPGDRTGTKAHYEWRGQYPPAGRHWAWKREQMAEFERQGLLLYSTNGVPRLKRYVDDGLGVPLQDMWTDINRLDAHSDERVGYETQKPLPLLDRIISASSNVGDVVLDPFCGTGTALVAAERTGRQWVGMDSSLLACAMSLARVRQEAHLQTIDLQGFPGDDKAALSLQKDEPVTFGIWGTSMLATLADRKAFNGSLATGTGLVRVSRRRVQLLSWVPLGSRPEGTLPTKRQRRVATAGVVLRLSRGTAGLRQWIERRVGCSVHEIEIRQLVDAASRRKGVASGLSEIAKGAA